MSNLIISALYLLITFLVTICCFKKYGKYGLYIWMCISVIICNIQTLKISEILGVAVSLGNISYGGIFLCTDILSEKYGLKSAKKGTTLSFLTMIIFTVLMQLFLMYKPAAADFSSDAMITIFSCMPRITVASLLAYYTSQTIDAHMYQFLKKKFGKIWISNNISTICSQIADTLIFVTIAFIGTIQNTEIIELIFTMIAFKIIIAFLDTPFIMLASKMSNEELE